MSLSPRSAIAMMRLARIVCVSSDVDHLRSLALDALRRHWRVIFGRTPPAESEQGPLGANDRLWQRHCDCK